MAEGEISEIETQTENTPMERKDATERFFSVESTASSYKFKYEPYASANYEHSLCGKDFLFKLAQIILGVTSAGLYSGGLHVMQKHTPISSFMFPNVVFSAFIIITSVIAMSYVLGHVMPEVLTRIFSAIGMVLYFVSACITSQTTYGLLSQKLEGYDITATWMLFGQVVTSFLNFVLYFVDLGLSIRRALKAVEIT